MKTKPVCIWSAFWKHGWILLKPGVQDSIGHCIIEIEIRVTGRSKTYAVVGRLSNLVLYVFGSRYNCEDILSHIDVYKHPGDEDQEVSPHWHYITFGLSGLKWDHSTER
jgi:hypothetical protein